MLVVGMLDGLQLLNYISQIVWLEMVAVTATLAPKIIAPCKGRCFQPGCGINSSFFAAVVQCQLRFYKCVAGWFKLAAVVNVTATGCMMIRLQHVPFLHTACRL